MNITFPPRVHAAFNHILLRFIDHIGYADIIVRTTTPSGKVIRCPLHWDLLGTSAERDMPGPIRTQARS